LLGQQYSASASESQESLLLFLEEHSKEIKKSEMLKEILFSHSMQINCGTLHSKSRIWQDSGGEQNQHLSEIIPHLRRDI